MSTMQIRGAKSVTAAVQVAAPAEFPVYLPCMPVLHVIMEMLLPMDVVDMGVVAQAGVVFSENMIEDLLGVIGCHDSGPAVSEPVLEVDHMGRYIQLLYIRF